MIELTNENVCADDEYPYYISIWCGSDEGTKKTISQIIDDYKKARKWEHYEDLWAFRDEYKQAQKLLELIRDRIKGWKTNEEPDLCQCDDCLEIRPHDIEVLEKLLEKAGIKFVSLKEFGEESARLFKEKFEESKK